MPQASPRSDFNRAARKWTLAMLLLATTALTGVFMFTDRKAEPAVVPLDSITVTAPVYPARAANQGELDKLCKMPGVDGPVGDWAGFTPLQRGGKFSRSLLSYARAARIYTCFYDNSSFGSTFEPSEGVARINQQEAFADRILQDVHATMHGYQRNEGKIDNDKTWDLHSRILQRLMSEAVANVSEFTAAAEVKENGDDSLWLQEDKYASAGWGLFKSVYADTKDVEKAASATINGLLSDRDFVSYQADKAIDSYIADWNNGKVSRQAGQKFSAAEATSMGEVPVGFSFARNIALPDAQALRNVAPELRRVLDVFAQGREDADVIKRISDMMAGDASFTARQALTRVDSDLSGQFNYANRENIAGVYASCAQADYRYGQVPKATKDLWQNLQTMRKGPLLGAGLVGFSEGANVFHCYFKMSNDNLGEWHDSDGLVRISSTAGASNASELTTQAHELVHAAQRIHGINDIDASWTIRDFQLMRLSYEAAGRAVQYLVALELNEAGVSAAPWQHVQNNFAPQAAAAEKAYRASGSKGKEALMAAGAAAWTSQFASRSWADAYNGGILRDFIAKIVNGEIKAPSGASYSLETARKTGWIGKDLNFTATIPSLPAYEDRFGGNVKMRQAFDYVGLEHIAYTLGRSSQQYAQELQRLEKDGNPYLGVDLKIIHGTLSNAKTTLTPMEAMDCFSGVASGCTYGGSDLSSGKYKIPMHPAGA